MWIKSYIYDVGSSGVHDDEPERWTPSTILLTQTPSVDLMRLSSTPQPSAIGPICTYSLNIRQAMESAATDWSFQFRYPCHDRDYLVEFFQYMSDSVHQLNTIGREPTFGLVSISIPPTWSHLRSSSTPVVRRDESCGTDMGVWWRFFCTCNRLLLLKNC